MNHDYYFNIAQNEAKTSNCLRRHIGAVIVKDGIIIGKGANKVLSHLTPCSESGGCIRDMLNFPRGKGYDVCDSVHAEINAIRSVTKVMLKNSNMYIVGYETSTGEIVEKLNCCEKCKESIVDSGIALVYIKQDINQYIEVYVKNWEYKVDKKFHINE
ncbi:deaminase [Lacrimispora sp.]|uniref:deaminase n=1 Tax=Lacrimispora sp. TaxID=2719234 RepID=UPI0028965EE1|nr:deaminase [Lacrimispora sp.]